MKEGEVEEPFVLDTLEKIREYLWLNHGCPISILYGDDGEKQCSKCWIDFKRDSFQKIFQTLISKARQEERERVGREFVEKWEGKK